MGKCFIFFGVFHSNTKANDNLIGPMVIPCQFHERWLEERFYLFKEKGRKENEKEFWILTWLMDIMYQDKCTNPRRLLSPNNDIIKIWKIGRIWLL